MEIILGIVIGLAWGACAAFANYIIMKNSIKQNTNKAMLLCNAGRMVNDVICLGVVFLVRNILPIHFVAAMVSTAGALSMMTIFFTFYLMKQQ